VSKRLSPVQRLQAEIDGVFAGGKDLSGAIEEVAEVTAFLGRERYERAASSDDARVGMRNSYCPTTVKTTAGPVTLQRPKVRIGKRCWCRVRGSSRRIAVRGWCFHRGRRGALGGDAVGAVHGDRVAVGDVLTQVVPGEGGAGAVIEAAGGDAAVGGVHGVSVGRCAPGPRLW
jgi:hypothetical protein